MADDTQGPLPLVSRQLLPNTAYSHAVKGRFGLNEDSAVTQVLVLKHDTVEFFDETLASCKPVHSQRLHGTVLQARSVPRSPAWDRAVPWLVGVMLDQNLLHRVVLTVQGLVSRAGQLSNAISNPTQSGTEGRRCRAPTPAMQWLCYSATAVSQLLATAASFTGGTLLLSCCSL